MLHNSVISDPSLEILNLPIIPVWLSSNFGTYDEEDVAQAVIKISPVADAKILLSAVKVPRSEKLCDTSFYI